MNWKKLKPYLWSVLLAVGVGVLSGFLTKGSMPAYEEVLKPPLTPPSFIFPVVWTLLYILMGIGAAIVAKTGGKGQERALRVYGLQLAVNFFWSILFFNLQAYFLAFVWLVLLWLLIIVMIARFWKVNRCAALLQLPYLLWVTFAGYLNLGIWLLNR